MHSENKRLQATVHGRVQGVYFRHNTRLRATSLGLAGWVANQANGTVKVIAEGPRNALDELLAYLHCGPPAAQVTHVEADWGTATGEFSDFQTRYR
jgi:acylphosphatase